MVVFSYPCSRNSRTAVSTIRRLVCSPAGMASGARPGARTGSGIEWPGVAAVVTCSTVAAGPGLAPYPGSGGDDLPRQRAQPGPGEADRRRPVPGQRPQAHQPGGIAVVHRPRVGHDGDLAFGLRVVQPRKARPGLREAGRQEIQAYELASPGEPAPGGSAQRALVVVEHGQQPDLRLGHRGGAGGPGTGRAGTGAAGTGRAGPAAAGTGAEVSSSTRPSLIDRFSTAELAVEMSLDTRIARPT